MKLSLLAFGSAFCFFFLAVHVRGQRVRYDFVRQMDSGQQVPQYGWSEDSGQYFVVHARLTWKNPDHLWPATLLGDFSSATGILVLRIHGECLILNKNSNYVDTRTKLENANGNTLTNNPTHIYLDVTEDGERITGAERNELFRTNPMLQYVCSPRFTPIFRMTSQGSLDPSDTEPSDDCAYRVSTTILDYRYTITVHAAYGYGCHNFT